MGFKKVMVGFFALVVYSSCGMGVGSAATVEITPDFTQDQVATLLQNSPAGTDFELADGVYNVSFGQTFESAPYWNYSLPDGTESDYTTLVAKNPGNVTIEGSIYIGGAVDGIAEGSQYIWIQGIKLRKGSITIRGSHHILVTYVGIKDPMHRVKRDGKWTHYGNGISVIEGSHHVTLDRFWIVGAFRYGFNIYQSSKVIARMGVLRGDTYWGQQPHAEANVYGADSSASPPIVGSSDVLLQNILVIDSNPNPQRGASIRGVHGITDTTYIGCMVANTPSNAFGSHEHAPGTNDSFIDCVAVDIGDHALYARGGDPGNFITVDRFDAIDADVDLGQWGAKYEENGEVDTDVRGEVTNNRRVVVTRYGARNTFWGEDGYDQEQGSLWPWPNEDWIKADFREPQAFEYPSSNHAGQSLIANDTMRGWAGTFGTLRAYFETLVGIDETIPVHDETPDPDPVPVMDPTTNIGRMMKLLRTEIGLTQAELGAAIGVSSSTISNIERGKGVALLTWFKMRDWFFRAYP